MEKLKLNPERESPALPGATKDNGLKELLMKIGHPIVDVRTRALQSLVFKLTNQIIQLDDLVHDHVFLKNLLEWFNMEEWTCETQVIQLLGSLTQNEAAAVFLVNIGGVVFISQLRPHLDSSLHPSIDEIIENLLKLPSSSIESHDGSKEDSEFHTGSSQSGTDSITSTETCTTNSTIATNHSLIPMPPSSNSYHVTYHNSLSEHYLLQTGGDHITTLTDSACTSSTTSTTKGQITDYKYEIFNHVTNPCNSSSHMTSDSESSSTMTTGRKRGVFPWLLISKVDHHILDTTISRLKSSSKSISETCSFIKNVLLKDFPPQLFLQRPTLIQVLLNHMSVSESTTESIDVVTQLSILDCLLVLSERLKKTLELSYYNILTNDMKDKITVSDDFHTPSSTPDLESLPCESLLLLFSRKLDITGFSELILSKVLKFLSTCIDTHLPWLNIEDNDTNDILINTLVGVVCVTMRLVISLCDLSMISVNEDEEESVRKISQSIHHLSVSLSQYISKMRRAKQSGIIPHNLLKVICPVMIVNGVCFSEVLSCCIPCNKTLSALSPVSCSVLKEVFTNPILSVMCSSFHTTLIPYLQCIDKGTAKLHDNEELMKRSFQSVHTYLTHMKSCDIKTLLISAETSLSGMYFNFGLEEKTIMEHVVKLCFKNIINDQDPHTTTQCHNLLLSLLSHGEENITALTYYTLKECLQSLKRPESVTGMIRRLFSSNFISQLCCHGILCGNNESVLNARVILCCLLKHLNRQADKLKEQLWKELKCVLPFIECCCSMDNELLGVVNTLINHTPSFLSPEERVCSLLRIMFSKSPEIRSKISTHLLKLLIEGSDPSWKLLISNRTSFPFHNILIYSSVSSHKCELKISTFVPQVKSSSSFKKEDISKLMSILQSPKMDAILKQSALEQFSVLLQDCSLHQYGIEGGLLKFILIMIHSHIQSFKSGTKDEEVQVPGFLAPSITCLQLLAHVSCDIRDVLCSDEHFLTNIIKSAIIYSVYDEVLLLISQLTALLVFSPVAKFTNPPNENGIRIPEILMKCLQLPFSVEPLPFISPTTPISPLDHTLLTSRPVRDRLSLYYAISIAGGIDEVQCEISPKGLSLDRCKVKLNTNSPKDDQIGVLFDLQSIVYTRPSVVISAIYSNTNEEALVSFDAITSQFQIASIIHTIEHKSTCTQINSTHSNTCTLPVEIFSIKSMFQKYLSIKPKDKTDFHKLSNIFKLLSDLLDSSCDPCNLIGQADIQWLLHEVTNEKAVCIPILKTYLTATDLDEHYRELIETMLIFYTSLMMKSLTNHVFSLPLFDILHHLLCVVSKQESYDLPLLQHGLQCLLHVTAKTRFYHVDTLHQTEWMKLCIDVMNTLRQILWSLLSGRGTMFTSFMGKGATKDAALSLSHLLYITSQISINKDWLITWLNSSSYTLVWLHSLLHDREPEVCYAGYSILTCLCSQPASSSLIISSWTDMHTHGLFGACIDTGLDQNESELIRQQSFSVLVSLLRTCHEYNLLDTLIHTHQQDETESSFSGSSAISLILQDGGVKQAFNIHLKHYIFSMEQFLLSKPVRRVLESGLILKHAPTHQGTDVHVHVLDDGINTSYLISELKQLFSEFHSTGQPQFLLSICQFLSTSICVCPEAVKHDIVNEDIKELLIRILSNYLMSIIILLYQEKVIKYEIVSVWIDVYTEAVGLLQSCVNEEGFHENIVEKSCLNSLKLLQFGAQIPPECSEPYNQLSSHVVLLVRTYLCTERKPDITECVLSTLISNWNSFTDLLCNSLTSPTLEISPQHPSPPPPLILMKESLVLLCTVLPTLHLTSRQPHDSHMMHTLAQTLCELLDGKSSSSNDCLVLKTMPGRRGSGDRKQTGFKSCNDDSSIESTRTIEYQRNKIEHCEDKSSTLEMKSIICNDTNNDSLGNNITQATSGMIESSSCNERSSACVSGSKLCTILIESYDNISLFTQYGKDGRRSLKELLRMSLSLLVASSNTAKETALKAGLLESTVNSMRTLHTKLSLKFVEQPSSRRKVSQEMIHLIRNMEFLQNFLYTSLLIKRVAVKSSLVSIIHNMWSLCAVNETLLRAALKLLIIFTAHCHEAQVSLTAHTKQGNSLLQHIIKTGSLYLTSHNSCITSRQRSPHYPALVDIFALLSNCVFSQECRGTLKKTNFLSSFLSINPKTDSLSNTRGSLTPLWLELLVNLTFSSEGQALVARLPGVIDVLIDIWTHSNTRCYSNQCLLVIRNQCFYQPTKPLFASNERVLMIFAECLRSHDFHMIIIAASGIWALLYNCTKLRSQLRHAQLHEILYEVSSSVQNEGFSSELSLQNSKLLSKNINNALSLLGVQN